MRVRRWKTSARNESKGRERKRSGSQSEGTPSDKSKSTVGRTRKMVNYA